MPRCSKGSEGSFDVNVFYLCCLIINHNIVAFYLSGDQAARGHWGLVRRRGPGPAEHILFRLEHPGHQPPPLLPLQHVRHRHIHLPAGLQIVSVMLHQLKDNLKQMYNDFLSCGTKAYKKPVECIILCGKLCRDFYHMKQMHYQCVLLVLSERGSLLL